MKVSNSPIYWPLIELFWVNSLYSIASSTIVVYDWALTFGQELELIWRKPWTFMTVMYLTVRYIGFPFSILTTFWNVPRISLSDRELNFSGSIVGDALTWTSLAVNFMISLVMINRIYAMYQHSRKVLIFLAVFFIALQITCISMTAVQVKISAKELVLSGTYQCIRNGASTSLITGTWIFGTVWEVILVGFAVRVATKHFRARRQLGPRTIDDCFVILIQTHILYFISFAITSGLTVGMQSTRISNSTSVGTQIYSGLLQCAVNVQMFLLAPRLILGVREYADKSARDPNEGMVLTTLAFEPLALSGDTLT